MREIKFRAWDKEKKGFHANVELYDIFQPVFDDGEELTFSDFLNKDRFDLQQFTGLTDKNGKEIYEGDIGKRILDADKRFKHDYEWADYWLIEWLDSLASFTTTLIGENSKNGYINKTPIRNEFSRRFNEIEVIGNIYQNKELLK